MVKAMSNGQLEQISMQISQTISGHVQICFLHFLCIGMPDLPHIVKTMRGGIHLLCLFYHLHLTCQAK